jgi:6-pyruvoyltetrahydropterin/6-carboxytetrahydropterin synthase
VLESQFDHTLLVAEDDPELEFYKEMEKRKLAKLTILPKLGCEGLADQLYKYVNGVYIPDYWGEGESKRLWCYRVEVRETQSNMAFREGHRCWNEDLFA